MNIQELQVRQDELQEEMRSRAIELGYNPENVEPVYDGVVDIERYLKSSPRVMWILKEAYDDVIKMGILMAADGQFCKIFLRGQLWRRL